MGNLLFSSEQASSVAEKDLGEQKTLVFLEGNISSGKSTLIANLRERGFPVWAEAVDRLTTEYVDPKGTNILDLFYQDKKEYGFRLQMVSMTTRWRLIKEALDHLHGASTADSTTDEDADTTISTTAQVSSDGEQITHRVEEPKERMQLTQSAIRQRIAFVERSILTDIFSFASMLHEGGFISELDWMIYTNSLREHLKDAVPHFGNVNVVFLYLRTEPEECFTRKVGRGRIEESPVDLGYLQLLHGRNEAWMNGPKQAVPRLVVNGHQTREQILDEVLERVGVFHCTAKKQSGIVLLNEELRAAPL